MPWLETAPMEQRERFIRDWQIGLYTMTELSARYDVSRKTGYKGSIGLAKAAGRRWAIGAERRINVPIASLKRLRS